MLDKRGRDIGEPKVFVRLAENTPRTPEAIARVRARQVAVQDKIHTIVNGYPTKCEILYAAEKPEGYGVPHGDPPPY